MVNVSALLGRPNPLGSYAWGLHVGIFVVWIPAVFATQRHTRDFKQRDFRKAALRRCPKWMRTMTFGFLGYAFVNFAWFWISSVASGSRRVPEASQLRGFSGHWMAFYSLALATLYSASHIEEVDAGRRCLQGHVVGPLAKFCEQCGSPVSPPGTHPNAV